MTLCLSKSPAFAGLILPETSAPNEPLQSPRANDFPQGHPRDVHRHYRANTSLRLVRPLLCQPQGSPCGSSPRELPVLAAPGQCFSVGFELVKEHQCLRSFSLLIKVLELWSFAELPLDCQGRILKTIVKPLSLHCGLAIENTPHTQGLSKLPFPNSLLLTSLHEGRMSKTN